MANMRDVRRRTNRMLDRASDMKDMIYEKMQDNPGTSSIIALASGIAIGALGSFLIMKMRD
jgi:hypothetical protein